MSTDAIPRVRQVGSWTQQKLNYLDKYLHAFMGATQRITSPLVYLDLFAGPGYDQLRDTGEIIAGSPVIAMRAGFSHVSLVDLDPANTAALRQLESKEPRGRVRIYTGDSNQQIDAVLSNVPRNFGAGFCFVDPAGLHANWETIRKISLYHRTGRNKLEQFILFPYDMGIVRMLVRDRDRDLDEVWAGASTQVSAIMPETYNWRSVYEARRNPHSPLSASQTRRRFAYIYQQGLQNLGYRYVPTPKLVGARPNSRPLYFLFFASDSDTGERIMTDVMNKPGLGEQLMMHSLIDLQLNEGSGWYRPPG